MRRDIDTLLVDLLRTARHVLQVRSDAAEEDEASAEAVELGRGLLVLHARILFGNDIPTAWRREGRCGASVNRWLMAGEEPPRAEDDS